MLVQTVICAVFLVFVHISNGAKIVLESDSKVIYPVATKQLNLRCSVKKGTWKLQQNASVGMNEPRKSGSKSISTEEQFEHLMSIVITEGKRETIASVTGCDPPVIERAFAGVVVAAGSAEMSHEPNEMGYMTLTWDRPLLKDADNFTCEAFALNSEKFSVSLNVSLEITAVEPNLADLLEYISSNDREIQRLQQNYKGTMEETSNIVHALKEDVQNHSHILTDKLMGLKAQNIQSGTFECKSQTVTFIREFSSPPKIFSTLTGISFNSNYPVEYTIMFTTVTKENFTVKCEMGQYYTYIKAYKIEWFAIDI